MTEKQKTEFLKNSDEACKDIALLMDEAQKSVIDEDNDNQDTSKKSKYEINFFDKYIEILNDMDGFLEEQ